MGMAPNYSPIIAAMVANAKQQTENNQQILEGQRQKDQVAHQKVQDAQQNRALDQAELSEKHHNEHEQSTLDIQRALADVQSQIGAMSRIKTVRDMIMGGVPQESINQNLGSNGGAPVQGMPTPQAMQAQQATQAGNVAGAQAGATAAAQAPYIEQQAESQFGRQQSLKDQQNSFDERMQGQHIASQEKIAQMSRGTQYGIAQMDNNTRLKLGGMDNSEGSSNLVRNLTIAGATGQIKLSPANPLERVALSNMQDMGWRTPDPKEVQAMKESQQLLPIFDKLRDFANTELPDDRGTAFLQGKGTEIKNALGISSEKQNKLNIINSQAMVIGKSVEGMTGRPLATQMKLDLDSLMTPGITKKDALNRIDNLTEQYVNKQANITQGGMPDSQKELLYHTQGVKPAWLAIAPQKSALGGKLDEPTSLKAVHPIYTGGQGPSQISAPQPPQYQPNLPAQPQQ